MVNFVVARYAEELAGLFVQEVDKVSAFASHLRKVTGFGGKGFRMKEVLLDMVNLQDSLVGICSHPLQFFFTVGVLCIIFCTMHP